MSTTTTSPASMTRSDTSWCGLAPFGPDPTITNSASAWPSATIAAAMSAATSASVRPARSHSPTRACTRSIAAPASRSAAISLASLRIRSSRSTGPASTWLDARRLVAQAEHVQRGRHVGHGQLARAAPSTPCASR